MSRNPQQQLVHFLSDLYSVEQQALAQLVSAPEIAGDESVAADYRTHHSETERQAELVEKRLKAHGGEPSAIKNAIMKAGGKGFLLFAKALPETPARLAAHSFSYEAMEWAGYQMLARFAEQTGDAETVQVARKIGDEEREMMKRIEEKFDIAEAVSREDSDPEEIRADLLKHLNEAHALEMQGVELLEKSKKIAGSSELVYVCTINVAGTQENAAFLEQRLKALDSSPSGSKDFAMRVFGLNWGLFFQAQSDTPAKLAAFVYAFEHLKIAGYALLKLFAENVGDEETAQLARTLLSKERSMAERIAGTFDSAVEATFAQLES